MKEMTLIDKAFLLKKNSLFSSVDIDLLLTIGDKFEAEGYKKGSKVFEIDQEAYRLYMIVDGCVAVKNRSGLILAELWPLELFGDEAVLGERKRGYDALCLTDTTLLSLQKSHLLAILNECPQVAASLLETYASNIDFRKH